MKVTTLSFEFDGRDEQEVINVTKMLKELLSGASDEVSVETHVVTPKKEEKPVAVSKTTSTAAPTFSEPTKTADTTKTAAPKKAKPEPAKVEEPAKAEEPARAEEPAKSEAPALKEMQTLVISSVRTGHVTRDEMASILLEFGGTSLSSVNPSKYALLKQRIENYPLTR
nr:MAG TPA: hypothetical protein [Caudoviricetes sp.]